MSARRLPVSGWTLLILLVLVGAGGYRRVDLCRMSKLQVTTDTPAYVSMAVNLSHGIGMHDPQAGVAFEKDPSTFHVERAPSADGLVPYTINDVGLSLVYRMALTLFPGAPNPQTALAWLQVLADTCNIVLAFWLGWRILDETMGLLTALVYAGLVPLVGMAATFPYYYYWALCFSLWNLCLVLAITRPGFAPASRAVGWRIAWGVPYGLLAGVEMMTRSALMPIVALGLVAMAVYWRREWKGMVPLLVAAVATMTLVMAPVALRSYRQFGQFHPPRLFWHTVYVGLGAHENPYGIQWDDGCGYRFAASKGLKADDPDWAAGYERILHEEIQRIAAENRGIFFRNAAINFYQGLTLRDESIRVELQVRKVGVKMDAGPSRSRIHVLLLLQALWFYLVIRRRASFWPYTLVLLQGLGMVAAVSMLCPPFLGYNSAYLPTFVVFFAMLMYCVGDAGVRAWKLVTSRCGGRGDRSSATSAEGQGRVGTAAPRENGAGGA